MLHVAVSHKNHEIARFAVQNDVDVNAEDRCPNHKPKGTPLWVAAQLERVWLQYNRAFAALRFGNTPFDDAIREGDMEMAEYLLSKGSRNMDRTDAQVSVQCSALRA